MKVITENIKAILALIIVLAAFGFIYMIVLLHPQDTTILSQAIIAVVGVLGTATGYYFGYSNGAAKKDEVLMANQQKPVVQQADNVNVNNQIP